MKKILSYFVALCIGLMAAAPAIPYNIPVMVNSCGWVYMVVVSALVAYFILSYEFHWSLKLLLVYLFADCFLSQVPYLSFNAFVLIVACYLFFLACRYCDYEVILNMVQAVFWLQITIAIVQAFGKDTLMSFGGGVQIENDVIKIMAEIRDKTVTFGTVFQSMRFSSLLAILSPLLLMKSKWYLIPLFMAAIWMGCLGFTFALAAGVLVWAFLNAQYNERKLLVFLVTFLCIACAVKSWSHIRVEVVEGRLPIWWVIVKSWCLDTSAQLNGPKDLFGISQTGPFCFKTTFFGHGIDTFLPLFPAYKHDGNPFPQAHNDWLQILWEIGLVGFCLFTFGYCAYLVRRLYKRKEYQRIAELTIIAVNMFLAFPYRMTQTVLLMIAHIAYCDRPHLVKRHALKTKGDLWD